MALLPSIASSNIADFFTRPLPTISHHRHTQLVIGDDPTPLLTLVATAPTVALAPTVVASAPTASFTTSDSVPTLHPNLALALTLPIVLDTGASFSRTPFASDFLPVAQAPYGLIRPPTSVVSNSKVNSVVSSFKVSSPVDPYTLITGEDTVDSVDLSSPDTTIDSDSGPYLQAFTLFHLIPIWIYSLLHFAVNLED